MSGNLGRSIMALICNLLIVCLATTQLESRALQSIAVVRPPTGSGLKMRLAAYGGTHATLVYASHLVVIVKGEGTAKIEYTKSTAFGDCGIK